MSRYAIPLSAIDREYREHAKGSKKDGTAWFWRRVSEYDRRINRARSRRKARARLAAYIHSDTPATAGAREVLSMIAQWRRAEKGDVR